MVIYLRLARSEEKAILAEFGDEYAAYRQEVPAFIPRRRHRHRTIQS
ncbi:isoprenylcysteine carboxylmethyltransferase family protein [Arthrobacter sp. MW3 TE3886]